MNNHLLLNQMFRKYAALNHELTPQPLKHFDYLTAVLDTQTLPCVTKIYNCDIICCRSIEFRVLRQSC